MKIWLAAVILLAFTQVNAQEDINYYRQIPAPAETYTAGSVASRMIDGLGFRFYWATEGLRKEDLAFKPGADSRTTGETIEHIYSMSFVILNATSKQPNTTPPSVDMSFEDMRKTVLNNLRQASEILRNSKDEELSEYNAVFQRNGTTTTRPFWNLINGPMSDCIWHTGQIVSYRRLSGNPFPKGVNLFAGTAEE